MNKFDIILFDFDDTLWARDTSSESDYLLSRDNILLLNKLAKSNVCTIVSGNTYDTIRKKIEKAVNLVDINFDIWADANSTLYKRDEKKAFIEDFSIDDEKEAIEDFLQIYELHGISYGYPKTTNIKIKPLNNLERNLLVTCFNDYATDNKLISRAFKTGTTTVDILSKNNSKENVLKSNFFKGFDSWKSLYIGDECYNGNDKDICNICTEYINVSNIKETNTLLKLLLGE